MIQEVLHFFGRAICHQLEERSLQAAGETLSVCARDTGIYLGIFSSLTYLHIFKRHRDITIPSVKISFFLLLFMVPMMIDGLGSYLHLFESTNVRRLVSGTGFGFVLPYFLYPLLSARVLENTSEPVVMGSKDLLVPLLLCSVLGGLVFWGALPHYVLDSFIILTVIVWFSLCASFLFSSVRSNRLKWPLSILISLGSLSILSLLHAWVLSYIN
ncbi:DUF2085 domain-containing protein [Neobacillus drentensis]|uniref:DUF2085 domain-containing protein n=1 Tax=Neobacillus drentensis TaxID=220684 RepID=UPI002FFEC485